MGVDQNIGYDIFPKQGESLGKRVSVCFNYDTSRLLYGTIVRDDLGPPFKGIIKLDDGRFILHTECQFTPGEAVPNASRPLRVELGGQTIRILEDQDLR